MSLTALLEQALCEGQFSSLASKDNTSSASVPPALLQQLQTLQLNEFSPAETLEQQLALQSPLPQRTANLLYFCDRLFEQCREEADLAPVLLDAFLPLRPLAAGVLLRATDMTQALTHPLFALLDLCWSAGRYWGPELGRQGEKYRSRLEDTLARLRGADPAGAPFADWLAELSAQLDKDAQRAELLATRICEAERGALAGQHAERAVRRQLNALLTSQTMPAAVEALLKEPFRHSLQQVFLSHGADSDEWHKLLKTGQMLLASMQSPTDEASRQLSYQMIPKVSPALARQLVSIGNQDEMESWLSQIEQLHMQMLLHGKVELAVAEPLSMLDDDSGVSTSVSSVLLEQVTQIRAGQWLVYQKENGESLRCRLALKLDDTGHLLFVNVLGAKCLEKSLEEFAYLLAARHVRLLDTDSNVSQLLNDTIGNVLQLYQHQTLLRADASARQRAADERRQRAQDKANEEARQLASDRLAAQQRAEQQAQLLVQAEAAAERERASQQQQQTHAQQQEAVQRAVRSLGVGAWVDMHVNGERQKCKLAAVINASDKLIFVGRDGRKLAETGREALTSAILDGQAVILERGDQFESSLARVIQTLRKD